MPRLQVRTQSSSILPTYGGDQSQQQQPSFGRGRLRTTSAVNLSIASEHVSPSRKSRLPSKTMSFSVSSAGRAYSEGSCPTSGNSLLPEFNSSGGESPSPVRSRSSAGRPPMKTSYRASVKGRGDVLPTSKSSTTNFASPTRGYSTDSAWRRVGHNASAAPLESIKAMSQRLRSRRRTSSTGDNLNNLDSSVHMSDNSSNNNNRRSSLGSCAGAQRNSGGSNTSNFWSGGGGSDSRSSDKQHRKQRHALSNLKHLRKREWAQIIVIAVVVFLVFDSYTKAVSTTERLDKYKEEEAMMMLHLQRIEQQSIYLHENLSRLGEASNNINNNNVLPSPPSDYIAAAPAASLQAPSSKGGSGGNAGGGEKVDSNLIRVQTQQLYQMEEELDHELRALQAKLQNVARSSIIRTYGEGPIQVVLELDFPNERSPEPGQHDISILLWSDTPHAAWTWLQQIQKGEWNGAPFNAGKSSSIDAAPLTANTGVLDFTEKSKRTHEAWTVGLSDTHNGKSLGMFINLQDNSVLRKRDVCVGKVIDGFDALQRLVDVSRQDRQRAVVIKRATATHLTRNQRAHAADAR